MPSLPRTARRAPRSPRRGPARRFPRLPVPGPLWLLPIAAVLLLLALLGVGRSTTPAPSGDRPTAPRGFQVQNVGYGTLLNLPRRPWTADTTDPNDVTEPLRTTVTSGPAVMSVWIYPRGRRVPSSKAQLRQARTRLLGAIKTRDASFEQAAVAVTRYDGLHAIAVRGTGSILGQPRTIRSVHVYVGGREIVIDAYAPGPDFRAVDKTVFQPVLRSLNVAPDWRRVRKPDGVTR